MPHTDNKVDFFRPVLLQEIQGEVREVKGRITIPAGSQYGPKGARHE